MKCEYGFCMTCEKEIAKECSTCKARKPTEDYTEVEVQWSNGSRMRIAVCKDCATKHVWATPEGKKGIAQAHWDHWHKIGGLYDPTVVIV